MKNIYILPLILFIISCGYKVREEINPKSENSVEEMKSSLINIVDSYFDSFDSYTIEIKKGRPFGTGGFSSIVKNRKFIKDYHYPENMVYIEIRYSDTLNNIKSGVDVYNFDLKENEYQIISHHFPLDDSGHMDNLGGNMWYDFDCDNFNSKTHNELVCNIYKIISDQ